MGSIAAAIISRVGRDISPPTYSILAGGETIEPLVMDEINSRLEDIGWSAAIAKATDLALRDGGALIVRQEQRANGTDPRQLSVVSLSEAAPVDYDAYNRPTAWLYEGQMLDAGNASLVEYDPAATPSERRVTGTGIGRGLLWAIAADAGEADAASSLIARKLRRSSQPAITMRGYNEMAVNAAKRDDLERLIDDIADRVDNGSLIPLDVTSTYSVAGVALSASDIEYLDRLITIAASRAGLPLAVLLGRTRAGLNATGHEDQLAWARQALQYQERMLRRPIVETIQSLGVRGLPQRWSIKFASIYQEPQSDVADRNAKLITALMGMHGAVLTGGDLVTTLRQMGIDIAYSGMALDGQQ